MMCVRTLTAMVAAVAISGAACSKKDDGAGEQPAAAATEARAGDPGAAAPADQGATEQAPSTADLEVDDEVLAEIKTVASTCGVDPKSGRLDCKNKEHAKLYDELYGYGAKAKSKVGTIGTLAVALADADPKVQTVAADLLGSRFGMGWGEGVAVGQVDERVAALLRATLPELGEAQARRAIHAVVYASSLSGTDAQMYPVIEAHPDELVRRRGWESSMFYGRMNAFGEIKGLAETGDPRQILTALTALHNMYEYTDDERARVCPWAHGLIGADPEGVEESDIFEKAGYVLTRCGGEWIDKLLDWGEAQRAKHVFDRKYYFVYRELCHSVMTGVVQVGATPAQCERNWKFLEETANTEGIEPKLRAWALSSISYSRRDERSYKLMKKYAKSKVPEIKQAAAEELKMLERYIAK